MKNNLISKKFLYKKKQKFDLISLSKIFLIGFMGLYLVGNFMPFYETNDGYTLATIAMKISEGKFFLTNELLEETGRFELTPGDWTRTLDKKSAFPLGPIGFHVLTAMFYSIGGNYALFYFGPILGILFLIVAERFTTHFFGKNVGFLTLLFLSTNHLFFRSTLNLQTENIFTIFFLLGMFFLIKFFQNKTYHTLFLASVFFSISPLFRISGVVFFPIELISIIGYFGYLQIKKRQTHSSLQNHPTSPIILRRNYSKIFKYSIAFSIPWILFFLFLFSFNDSLFGDPFTNQKIVQRGLDEPNSTVLSLINLEEKNFENIKQYSKYLLPYQFPAVDEEFFSHYNQYFGQNWLGIISLIILAISLITSFKTKYKRKEILLFILFIIGTIWFYAAITSAERAAFGVPGRYMYPAFTLFYIILSSLILNTFSMNSIQKSLNYKTGKKILQYVVVGALFIFFIFAFFFTPPIKALNDSNFQIHDPYLLSQEHPPSHEGLAPNSVIVAYKTDRVLEYNMISFQYRGINYQDEEPDTIDLLKEIIKNNYDVYVFKKPTHPFEKRTLTELVNEHGFILSDYSTSFCKMEHSNEKDTNRSTSENTCLKEPL